MCKELIPQVFFFFFINYFFFLAQLFDVEEPNYGQLFNFVGIFMPLVEDPVTLKYRVVTKAEMIDQSCNLKELKCINYRQGGFNFISGLYKYLNINFY